MASSESVPYQGSVTGDHAPRTADGVDFYVYRIVLSLASPFFADMFSLQPPPPSDVPTTPEPIVIPETSGTFDSLLRFCYPVDDPTIDDLSHLGCVIEAAQKYQIAYAIKLSRRMISSFIATHTLEVFAIACRLKLEDEARLAAVEWKKAHRSHFQDDSPRFHEITACATFSSATTTLSAGEYYRLLSYCRAGLWKMFTNVVFTRRYNPYARLETRPSFETVEDGSMPSYLALEDADVILRSIDGEEFPSHTLLLRLASAEILVGEIKQIPHEDSSGRPVLQLGVASQTLRDFLCMCRPSADYELDDPQRLWKLLQFATRYKMTGVVSACRKQANRLLLSSRPLSMYFLAALCGWKEEALAAARILAKRKIEYEYDALMEDAPAPVYNSLLQFHHASVTATLAAVNEHAPACHQWKTKPKSLIETAPLSISIPIVEQELSIFTTVDTDVCRGCSRSISRMSPAFRKIRRANKSDGMGEEQISPSDSHSTCKYNIATLLTSSEKLEQAIRDKLMKIQLDLRDLTTCT